MRLAGGGRVVFPDESSPPHHHHTRIMRVINNKQNLHLFQARLAMPNAKEMARYARAQNSTRATYTARAEKSKAANLLTVDEAARFLGIKPSTLQQKRRTIPPTCKGPSPTTGRRCSLYHIDALRRAKKEMREAQAEREEKKRRKRGIENYDPTPKEETADGWFCYIPGMGKVYGDRTLSECLLFRDNPPEEIEGLVPFMKILRKDSHKGSYRAREGLPPAPRYTIKHFQD